MNPVLGEIRMFAGNFAPAGWAFCNGQMMEIARNQHLFEVLGTMYGGDGKTSFALPDLRGRTPVGSGYGPGLPSFRQGDSRGRAEVTLTQREMPSHFHSVSGKILATDDRADTRDPDGAAFANDRGTYTYRTNASANVSMQEDSIQGSLGEVGAGLPYSNFQPSLGLNFIISLRGSFPSPQ
ncbi:MAG: tail fiber protein [Bacteroidota bacterium]